MTVKKRIFLGSLATETNTFSPLRTDLRDFKDSFYASPGEHPATPTLCSAVFPVARDYASQYHWELIEGTATWAEPGGVVNQHTWEFLRDQLLREVEDALPLDAVVLGLHGAMIAQDCLDCEGELLAEVRKLVGPDVIIAATLDPHSHLSEQRVASADLLVAFKEFPHTDFVDVAHRLIELTQQTLRQQITPVISVFDCKMIDVLPTSQEPMRGFVDRLLALEESGTVLSASVIHGFMAADVPDLGAKMIVITNNDIEAGNALSKSLGMELFSFRGTTRPPFLPPNEAIDQAQRIIRDNVSTTASEPVVVADVWDNPGGGVAGDSTIILRELIQRDLRDTALASIWDPIAVRTCFSAGTGATLRLRFGGKMSDTAGEPIDATVIVQRLVPAAVQSFGDSIVPLGDSVCISVAGIQVILNTIRSQVFNPDIFSNLGIDPLSMKLLVVKSTNHFHAAFSPIASTVIYAAVDGPYPNDPATNHYQQLTRSLWPRVADPHNQRN